MKFDLVIVAGGSSSRAGENKLRFNIGNQSVLERTINAFFAVENIQKIILVVREDDMDFAKEIVDGFYAPHRFEIVLGGETRSKSVYNGLLKATAEGVLIHDGARPYVDCDLIERVMLSVERYGSGIPALPLADSVRVVEDDNIVDEANRDKLYRVQTPQGFKLNELLSCYANGKEYTDESLLYSTYVAPARIVEGSERNVKLTTAGDLTSLSSRVGIGYDLHKLALFRKLVLGGIEIAYDYGCVAHSDGDVVIHALIDAILSAIGERDIGTLFPDDDPKYLDIDSTLLLTEVMELCTRKNYRIKSASVIIVLQKPRIGDYIPIMRVKLANIMGIKSADVAISAKTNEGVGDIGEGKAVAAYASVQVY
ncbi:MAG: 2-C-methyl-D-erythritol 2,4-cyclodiphosphate synthase [Clostridia bacterium]|nr:2-C-methyl-D-erythritol 2,4-cyclodiphosphate synthase [Clostridia bacterium]